MASLRTLEVRKLTPTVGAEVLGVDVERLLGDEDLPHAMMEALDENGVLVFPGLNLDDQSHAAFCRKLGEVRMWPDYDPPEVFVVSLNPENPNAEYLRGTVEWHIDGTLDQDVPMKAAMLSAKAVSSLGGETEFASTYGAYDDWSEEERERYEALRVLHSFAATQRSSYPNPTTEQQAEWEKRGRESTARVDAPVRRKSLVISSSADHVVGMDVEAGRTLLRELLAQATAPDRVYRHSWSAGDTIMWDNGGLLHRVLPYDPGSRRELHRTSLIGDEPIR